MSLLFKKPTTWFIQTWEKEENKQTKMLVPYQNLCLFFTIFQNVRKNIVLLILSVKGTFAIL